MHFTTTWLSGLRAAGRTKELQHSVIAPFLERELGPAFGRLFADFEVESSDVRAWYTDAAIPPRRVIDMAVDAQTALRQRTAEMIARIIAFAEEIAPKSPQNAYLRRMLITATTFPIEDIWADGDQPIIVNWGFHRRTAEVGPPREIIALMPPAPHTGPEAPRGASAAGQTILTPVLDVATTMPGARPSIRRILIPLLLLLFLVIVIGACWRLLLAPSQVRLVGRPATSDEEQQHRQRLTPGAPQGNVEVSLEWDSQVDLDLIIRCPGGDKLFHGSPGLRACGGRLQKDINVGGSRIDNPIEQAAWAIAPAGTFTIEVELFSYNGIPDSTDIPFRIRIRRGSRVEVINGGHIRVLRTTVVVTSTSL